VTAIHDLSALAQGRAIQDGELSPVEVTRHYLDRIQARDGTLGAYVTVTADRALEQAAQAEREVRDARRRGEPLGPLHGVPVAVKDVVRVDGVPRTLGSALPAEESDVDDHVVARLRAAGMPVLGTTNTPEFALPCYTENRLRRPTRNPWHGDYSPGGSSGGSAAAVAAGLAPLAHGTDAGGSVRIPASACGLVGLKPSRGRVSNGPLDHDVTGLSVHGAIARDPADAAALLAAMTGPMPGDTYTAPEFAAATAPLRVVVLAEPMLPDVQAHPDCLAALDVAVKLLEAAGHQVEAVAMSPDQGVADAFRTAWSTVAARVPVEEEDEELLTPFTRYLREIGRGLSGVELHAALATFRGIGQLLADMFFANYELVLTPTLATPPAVTGAFSSDPDQGADFDRMSAFMPYTPLANIAGLPSLTLPLHRTPDGLPIGVMLTGGYGTEATVLRAAGDLLAARGPERERPPGW
jgi:amidase